MESIQHDESNENLRRYRGRTEDIVAMYCKPEVAMQEAVDLSVTEMPCDVAHGECHRLENQKRRHEGVLIIVWRRARDSNPRREFCPLTRLAGEHLRPLGQLSEHNTVQNEMIPFRLLRVKRRNAILCLDVARKGELCIRYHCKTSTSGRYCSRCFQPFCY